MLLTSAAAIVLSTACFNSENDRPPPLTFDKHVDYVTWYNDFVSQGKKDNAYELYKGLNADEQGRGGLPELEDPAKEQLDKALKHPWKRKDCPDLAAYLKECAPCLKTFKKAVKRRDYWLPAPADTKLLCALAMPGLASSRAGSKAMLAQALMKQDAQSEAVIDACRVVLKNADHMQQSDILIGVLVGLAHRALVYSVASAALGEGVIDGEDITTLYTTIHRHDPASPDPRRWLAFEWASELNTLQFMCPNGKYDTTRWRDYHRIVCHVDSPATSAMDSFDPRETVRLLDQHFGGIAEIISRPLSLKTTREFLKFEEEQAAKLKANSFTAEFAPSLGRAHMLQLRAEAQRRATLLILAIHAHHAKHGKWPASLDQIDGKLGLKGLEELREDPFSGKEFIYKLKDGEPLLYTVCTNGKDDGGRHDKKWGEGEADSDYVFWPLPR